jgi:hypothetical protein
MRFSFGGDLAGWHIGYGDEATATETGLTGRIAIALGGVNVQFWDADTGGTQYTDLLDDVGGAVTEIQTSAGTADYPLGVLPRFSGPDGVAVMYAQPGAGPRLRVTAVDAYLYFNDEVGDVSALQSDLESIGNRVDVVEADTATAAADIAALTPAIDELEDWRRYPVAELRPTGSNTLTNATWTTLTFAAELVDSDQDDIGAHSTVTNVGRFQARYAGLHLLAGAINYNANSTGVRYARWLFNGSTRPATHAGVGASASGGITVFPPTMVQWLEVGDYVELQGHQTSGGSLTTVSADTAYYSHMTVVYLRPLPAGVMG